MSYKENPKTKGSGIVCCIPLGEPVDVSIDIWRRVIERRTGEMSEPRTMLDVARDLGRLVSGEREWDRAFAWAKEMRQYLEFAQLCAVLSEVFTDSAGRIEALQAEVGQLRAELNTARADAARELVRARTPMTL